MAEQSEQKSSKKIIFPEIPGTDIPFGFGPLLGRLIDTQWERCLREAPTLRRSVEMYTNQKRVIESISGKISSGYMSEIVNGLSFPPKPQEFLAEIGSKFLLHDKERVLLEEVLDSERREKKGIQSQDRIGLVAAVVSNRLGEQITREQLITMYTQFFTTGLIEEDLQS